MGSAVSKLHGLHAVKEEVHRMSVLEALGGAMDFGANAASCSPREPLDGALERLGGNAARAMPVVRDGEIVAVLDYAIVLHYLLLLFGDATEQRTVVTDYGGMGMNDMGMGMGRYGGLTGLDMRGFHAFVDVREKSFVAEDADKIIMWGTRLFDKDVVEDLLRRTEKHRSKKAAGPSNDSVAITAKLVDLMALFARGYHSVCVFRPDPDNLGFGFLSEMDSLRILKNLIDKHELDLSTVKIKRLGLAKERPEMLQGSSRVMHAFKTMAEKNISAMPIVRPPRDDQYTVEPEKMEITGEFSLDALHTLNHETLKRVLGTVSAYLWETDREKKRYSSPITCSRRDSLGAVIQKMVDHQRTHIWAVTKKNFVKGVLSVNDVWRLLWKRSK